ncbi:conserved hypothetical protein [Thermococcus sp. AM4]|nr:conserved hypothetical protein [Thermococcus sp. AM4]
MEMPFGRKISYEEGSAIKIVLVFAVIFLGVLAALLYPLIHRGEVYEVSSPKGQPLLARNFTIDGVSYKNAVAFGAGRNDLVIRSYSLEPTDIKITLKTPGWCMDLWQWGGMERGWILEKNCTRVLSISYYSFEPRAARESGEVYLVLGSGTMVVFHKNGPVRHYEEVNFTVSYSGREDVGYFLVSLGKR